MNYCHFKDPVGYLYIPVVVALLSLTKGVTGSNKTISNFNLFNFNDCRQKEHKTSGFLEHFLFDGLINHSHPYI